MSIFKNLEDAFLQTVDQLYGSLSRNPAGVGIAAVDLLAEIKPPKFPNTTLLNESRGFPLASINKDAKFLTRWSKSNKGVLFYAKEALLQSGNAISETRFFNPLFVVANADPYLHLRRALFTQQDFIVSDPTRSPASTPQIGFAGRLQKDTAAASLSNVLKTSPTSKNLLTKVMGFLGISNLLPLGLLSGKVGTLGVDQRPELDIQGKYWSVVMWQGLQDQNSKLLNAVSNAITSAGALSSISSIESLGIGLLSGTPKNATIIQGAGQKYFILDKDTAVRYIKKTTQLNRNPQIFSLPSVASALPGVSSISSKASLAQSNLTNAAANAELTAKNHAQNLKSGFPINPQLPVGGGDTTSLDQLTDPNSALENRYATDTRLNFVRQQLDAQAKAITAPDFKLRGIVGGLTPDAIKDMKTESDFVNVSRNIKVRPNNIVSALTAGVGTTSAPGYYHDTMNEGASIFAGKLNGPPPPLPETFPKDFIKVQFYDVVNNRILPFRAIIADITETVTPAYNPTQYIGRIERNIVYLGAERNVTFSLYIVAFSPNELKVIWEKLNYLTMMAFPSKYTNDGFLVPPFIELTLGELYKTQPGYISALSNAIEEDVSWEVENGAQVPHVIKSTITFEIIEKFALNAAANFFNGHRGLYGFGNPVAPDTTTPTPSQPNQQIRRTPVGGNNGTITGVVTAGGGSITSTRSLP